jgi:Rod binding domain-containing protein
MSQIKQIPANIHSRQSTYEKYRGAPREYMEIAEGMESQFIGHLLGEMRKTVHTEEPESSATQFYNSLLDQERSQIMAKTDNGIGLKDIILDQIVPAHLKNNNQNTNAVRMYQQNAGNIQGVKDE